jgi:hypothetical protein
MAKETAGMISAAYGLYQKSTTVPSSAIPGAITQYMNYTSIKTSGAIDSIWAMNCSALEPGNYDPSWFSW